MIKLLNILIEKLKTKNNSRRVAEYGYVKLPPRAETEDQKRFIEIETGEEFEAAYLWPPREVTYRKGYLDHVDRQGALRRDITAAFDKGYRPTHYIITSESNNQFDENLITLQYYLLDRFYTSSQKDKVPRRKS